MATYMPLCLLHKTVFPPVPQASTASTEAQVGSAVVTIAGIAHHGSTADSYSWGSLHGVVYRRCYSLCCSPTGLLSVCFGKRGRQSVGR